MPYTGQLRIDLTANSGAFSSVRNITGDLQTEMSQVIAAGATNVNILLAIDITKVKLLLIKSSVNMTFKTNSSGSPANTINLLAGIPYVWAAGGYETLVLTTNVSSIFVTNGTATDGLLEVYALSDL